MSKPTLGGTVFSFRAISQDYCLKETVDCLKALCDEVVILDAGSDDGSAELVKSFEDEKTKVILLDKSEWDAQRGREKLSYFTNLAINHLTTDWNIYCQADEIIHESCFQAIREAIEDDNAEAYMVSRINLWKDPFHQLNVAHNRKPCSTEVIRLARSYYKAIGDAESINAQANLNYLEQIRMYHMGFVRKKEIMPKKIRHMQGEVFLMDVDKKLDGMEVFDSSLWFTDEDLTPIKEPLPIFIQEWAKTRP